MRKNQTLHKLLKHHQILIVIIAGFFLREISLIAIIPLFGGQDEARHYNTIQLINESDSPVELVQEPKEIINKRAFETYNFSEEIRETARLAQTYQSPRKYYEKIIFSESSTGISEEKIISQKELAYNKYYPPDVISSTRFYHLLLSIFEHIFENQSILFRFFSIRTISALIGSITILLSYFIAKNIGFSKKESLLVTAAISFHPKLSLYLTNINYDALIIPIFTAFSLTAILNIKNPSWKNSLSLFAIAIAGFLTKGTGIILLAIAPLLLAFNVYKFIDWKKINQKFLILSSFLIILILSVAAFKFISRELAPANISSLFEYIPKSISKIPSSSENYWGDLDWTRNDYSEWFIKAIWIIEIIAYAGIALYITNLKKSQFTPQKKYLFIFLLIMGALQLGIRFYDFKIFSLVGTLELGTPGRYFLPNISAHALIVFSGLSVFFKKRKNFESALLIGLALMFVFFLHSIFNSIIPNFYL